MLTEAAYGFRVDGMPERGWLALHGAQHWPVLTLNLNGSVSRSGMARLDPMRMYADVSEDLPHDEIVHPLLGRMLTSLAADRGIDAVHGGALLGANGAWVLIGAREAGKSSLLAQCHREGAQVLTEDIVVLEGTRCLAGPRFIDLRAGTAELLGPGIAARGGTKQRIRLPPAPADAEMTGVVHLAWGSTVEVTEVSPAERIARLVNHRATRIWPRSLTVALDMADLPTFELRRPQKLSSLRDSAHVLMDHIGAQRARKAPT